MAHQFIAAFSLSVAILLSTSVCAADENNVSASCFSDSCRINTAIIARKARNIAPTILVGGTITAGVLLYDLNNSDDDIDSADVINRRIESILQNQFLIGTLVGGYVTSAISGAINGVKSMCTRMLGGHVEEDERAAMLRELLRLRYHAEGLRREAILSARHYPRIAEAIDYGIAQCDTATAKIEGVLTHKKIENLKRAIEMIAQFPREPISLSSAQIMTNLTPHLQGLPTNFEDIFRKFVEKVTLDPARMDHARAHGKKCAPSTRVLYFYGPAGTGKTTFAHNLAKSFAAPLIEISLANCKSGKLRRAKDSSRFYGKEALLNLEKPSELTCALSCMKGKFGFIFIDEADKALNNIADYEMMYLHGELLELLNLNRDFLLEDVDLFVEVNVIFILAGNTLIKNSFLRSRMETVVFDGFSKEDKRALAERSLEQLFELYGVVHDIDDELGKLLDAMIDDDPSPGVRAMDLVLDDLAAWVKSRTDDFTFSDYRYQDAFEKFDVIVHSRENNDDASNKTSIKSARAGMRDNDGSGHYGAMGESMGKGIVDNLVNAELKIRLVNKEK